MNTDAKANPVLIVTASDGRFELQDRLQETLNEPVSVAATFQEAENAIVLRHFARVILDEGLVDMYPSGADRFLARCSHEQLIYVKLAITRLSRCIQQIRLAVRRFDWEQRAASASAKRSIRSQVRDVLTSIVMHGQLALSNSGLPQATTEHIKSILERAESMQEIIDSKID
jgi:hypothetical protein